MNFPPAFYQHLKDHPYVGIKGGRTRKTFLEIWMVQVDGRVFARSWDKSARSWFTAFQEEGVGELQFGDQVIQVRGRKLEPDPATTELINQAYLKRFNEPHNLYYSNGITQPEYADYTMEFFYDID